MPKLILEKLGRLNGEYECPTLHDLTQAELHFIWRQSGIDPPGIAGAVMQQNTGVAVSMASVALNRVEKDHDLQELWDSTYGSIIFDFTEEMAEKPNPPEQPPSEPTEPESPGGNPEGAESSG